MYIRRNIVKSSCSSVHCKCLSCMSTEVVETQAHWKGYMERAQMVCLTEKHSTVMSLWQTNYGEGKREIPWVLESSWSSKEKPKTSCHCMKRIATRPVGIGLLGASLNIPTVQRLFSALENMKGMFKNLKARSVPVLWSGRGKQIFTSP